LRIPDRGPGWVEALLKIAVIAVIADIGAIGNI